MGGLKSSKPLGGGGGVKKPLLKMTQSPVKSDKPSAEKEPTPVQPAVTGKAGDEDTEASEKEAPKVLS